MKLEENTVKNDHSVSFFKLLTVALIVLRLMGYIDWPWYWVILPLFIPAIAMIIAMLVILFVSIIKGLLEEVNEHDE